ncbi:MAG: hypothetical protein R8G66_22155 [Cytophagales bacterium]|nr:hypothetical protein [Cytophagales bacterium]
MRLLFTILYSLGIFGLFAQGVASDYQSWLASTPLTDVFEVDSYNSGRGELTIGVKAAFDDPLKIEMAYVLLDRLTEHYDSLEADMARFILNRLIRLTNRPFSEVAIVFRSEFNQEEFMRIQYLPLLFVGYDPPEIKITKNYTSERSALEVDLDDLSMFDMSGMIPLQKPIGKARGVLRQAVMNYVEANLNVGPELISIDTTDSFQHLFIVEGKEIITPSYHEQIQISVHFAEVSNIQTQINYDVSGFYARGIGERGAFKPFPTAYKDRLIVVFSNFISEVFVVDGSSR